MRKKTYKRPSVKCISLCYERHLANHTTTVTEATEASARKSSIWDDEEEEENTGGWFQ